MPGSGENIGNGIGQTMMPSQIRFDARVSYDDGHAPRWRSWRRSNRLARELNQFCDLASQVNEGDPTLVKGHIRDGGDD